ncbi:papain family cysteine protease domain containing protein family [Trichomonas vaginalis G3]|uniref:papain family cysteine protease domain containing protein family n=1 Tax=Trichomonas vaginalis (strain ATCC PRA-98 / G3) TaxID=412133 RepID=UPI0021E580A2|nr:papain family cysteine protease domain containing protein family [Trichomonas vaginalis G3]KAI5524919.1 papain family cysteine protease domain containing protein family [Trichomonas vaginalis G3]
MEEIELLKEESSNSNISSKVKKLIILSVLIVVIVFAIFIFFSKVTKIEIKKTQNLYNKLPSKYFISSIYSIPLNTEYKAQKSWLYTSLNIMESLYKYNGYMKGFLNETEYVKFSPYYISDTLNSFCSKNTNIEPCNSTRTEGKSIYPTFEDFAKFIKTYSSILIPESACKVQNNKCNVDTDVYSDSKIDFNMESSKIVTTISQIKELLYKNRSPLGFVMPMPATRYKLPCSDILVNQTELCKKTSLGFGYLTFNESFESNGPSFYHITGDVIKTETRSLELIGWDDNFIEPLSSNITNAPPTKGAFIFKGTWGSTGHSREYLSGIIPRNIENALCPNSYDPLNFIPASLQCVAENGGDLSKCSTDMSSTGATQLVCVDPNFCNEDESYFVTRNSDLSKSASIYTENNIVYPIIRSIKGSVVSSMQFPVPFSHLHKVFAPKSPIPNNEAFCGHVAISYRVIEELQRLSNPYSESIRAISLEVNFYNESYAAYKKKAHKFTKNSTSNFQPITSKFTFTDL